MTVEHDESQRAFAQVSDDASYAAFVANAEAANAQLARLMQHLRCSDTWHRPKRGTALVALGEGEVVKLMPPHDRALALNEAACLSALHGALPIATPRLLDTGDFGNWRYLRMTRLPGVELTEHWPRLSAAVTLRLATQLGEALRVLHSLDAPTIVPRLAWSGWCEQRRVDCVRMQRAKRCPEFWLEQLPDFLSRAPLDEQRSAWLHTEIMREHLLVDEVDGACRLSGVFDFEPSWVAPVDYEFASVGLFFSAGDPRVLGAVLRVAGVSPSPQRLLAMMLMHRYVNLGWYWQRLGGPRDLDALAEAWFGTV